MKTHLLFILLTCLSCQWAFAGSIPNREFRATWFATVENIDWPKTYITNASSRTQQQKELTDIFDQLVAGNMNAACMQVRSMCDAMYKSSYEPWSRALTDERGKDPGYDPLAFAIEEAHKRGLELHIWVNPFRVTSSGTISTSDKIWQNAGQWIIKYNNGSFFGQIIDPGYPEAREYVIKVLMEIVNNYDVDGIVMDDYFYPYGGTTTEDADSKSKYKPNNVVDVNQDGRTDDDWRRSNVDACLKDLYDTIQAVKPWVRFGMGTFGIWTMQQKAADAYGLALPKGISGLDDYEVQACNPIEWVKDGYVDYINPQLYWSTNIAAQDYNVLCKWWAKDVCEHFSNQLPDGKKVHFFISQAAYHAYDGYKGYDAGVAEIQKQIDVNRANLSSGYTGSVFYNTTAYCKMYEQLAQTHFPNNALPPAMDWKVKQPLSAPTNLTLSGNIISWQHPTAERFTVYAYPFGLDFATAHKSGKYLQKVVYGNSCELHIKDLESMTIAVCTYDRFGVEYTAATYNAVTFPESDPNATEISWVLNGGEIKELIVPTNEQLWEQWKLDYIAFYTNMFGAEFEPAEDREINDVLGFTSITWKRKGALAKDFMTQSAEWKWLAEYILAIAEADGYTIESDNDWRYHLYSFFNCTDAAYRINGNLANNTADFTTAGKPEAWGKYYPSAEEKKKELPKQVTETYILPQPTHPNGYEFFGWYISETVIGDPVIAIPAGWKGKLYAHWKSVITNIEDVTIEDIPYVYDIMGRFLGNELPVNSHGIFIIQTGDKTIKVIR